jgi:hypothetical protein
MLEYRMAPIQMRSPTIDSESKLVPDWGLEPAHKINNGQNHIMVGCFFITGCKDFTETRVARAIRLVAEGRPGQIGDVQGDNRSLQQSRAGLPLLDSWGDGKDAGSKAQNDVDGQEELVHGAAVGLDFTAVVIIVIFNFIWHSSHE